MSPPYFRALRGLVQLPTVSGRLCEILPTIGPRPAWLLAAALVIAAPATRCAPPATGDGEYRSGQPGPWGELVYTRILVEPPDELLASDYSTPNKVEWVFPGYTPERLAALWRSAGLDARQLQEIAADTRSDAAKGALLVTPSAGLILSLSTPARAAIYSALSAYPENPDQQEPFRFRADDAAEWFANSGLAPETVTMVKRLLYRRGSSLLFSDHDIVLPRLPSRSERLRLVKTLARKSTMFVQLRVTPESDIDALAAYWARGPRRKDVHALLQSIALRPGGTLIDITHLLPRFARARLFTYPAAPDHAGDANYDCHWSSLNFFNDVPDDRFANTEFVQNSLNQDYVAIDDHPLLGDVLVFFRPDGRAIHSCVYIADNVVFTKNGASQVMPWILMDLRDVVAFYPSDPPLVIRAYRRKEL